jgi:hypothetical protein
MLLTLSMATRGRDCDERVDQRTHRGDPVRAASRRHSGTNAVIIISPTPVDARHQKGPPMRPENPACMPLCGALFDNLVGAGEDRGRHHKAE